MSFCRNKQGKADKGDGDGVAHDMDVVDLKHTMIEEEEISNNLKIKVKCEVIAFQIYVKNCKASLFCNMKTEKNCEN